MMESQHSITVEIPKEFEDFSLNKTRSPFSPPVDIDLSASRHSSEANSHSHERGDAPEKKITLFAMRLAILEKGATNLGTLAFVWATVVLLGGFAVTLNIIDFWFVTIILLFEGTRIFSRSHELEWQHEISMEIHDFKDDFVRLSSRVYGAIVGASNNDSRKKFKTVPKPDSLPKRIWSSSNVRLIPYTGWLFISGNVSGILFWIQIFLGFTCVGLSLSRLAINSYGETSDGDNNNRISAIVIFYGLSVVEAALFLMEKAYWQWKIVRRKLFSAVSTELGLDNSAGPQAVRRFFYDAYARAVNGSVFDGLKMEFVSFGVELLMQSDPSSRAHLTGARILCSLVSNNRFKEDTLRALGTMRDVVERLVEILSWKNHDAQEIRREAAEIVFQLVRSHRNCVRVAAIEGSLESISSLLYQHHHPRRHHRDGEMYYDYHGFTVVGLMILNNLAKDADNCSKIGSTRGLLSKIVDTMKLEGYGNDSSYSDLAKEILEESLYFLKQLASTTGITGRHLRRDILENVFTIGYIRDVIFHYKGDPKLQVLGIDTLSSLALENEGREIIGTTGGILSMLLELFFEESMQGKRNELVWKAGEALALLALDSEHNCKIIRGIHQGRFVRDLVNKIGGSKRGIHAAKILTRISSFLEEGDIEVESMKQETGKILSLVMTEKQGPHQEAAIGLGASLLRFLNVSEFGRGIEDSGCSDEESLVRKIGEILAEYPLPCKDVPCIRRNCVQFLGEVLLKERERGWSTRDVELRKKLKRSLEEMVETTSEIENYNIFSGSVGINRHPVCMRELVYSVMDRFHE